MNYLALVNLKKKERPENIQNDRPLHTTQEVSILGSRSDGSRHGELIESVRTLYDMVE